LDYIYDLHPLIVQRELGPVALVGHSMGGAIAGVFCRYLPGTGLRTDLD
jgi:pimeloyl-ACP methyl ester carboxylesterase